MLAAILHGILIVLIICAAIVYLIPTWLAVARKHHWIPRILLVNILLGWTIIGWAVALHMALTSRTKTKAYWRPTDNAASPTGQAASFVPKSAPVATITKAPDSEQTEPS